MLPAHSSAKKRGWGEARETHALDHIDHIVLLFSAAQCELARAL